VPRVTVVIPNYNGRALLGPCLSSLLRQSFEDFEVVVVDNGSRDGSADYVRANFPSVRLIELESNLGFSAAVNAGIRATVSEYVAVLNNDTEVEPEWLSSLVAALDSDASAGSAASKILWAHAKDRIYAAGDFFCQEGFGGNIGSSMPDGPEFSKPFRPFSASACAALYRREMLDKIGLFDERFFIFFEDIDLGFRAQLFGYGCLFVPSAVVYHTGTASVGIFSAIRRYHLLRNEMWVLAKNLPRTVLAANLARIVRHQMREAVMALFDGSAAVLLRAKLAALCGLKRAVRSRRALARAKRVTDKQIADLVESQSRLLKALAGPPPGVTAHAKAAGGARTVLVIRSAGLLLDRAIGYAKEELGAEQVDVLALPGHEHNIPAEPGVSILTLPEGECFSPFAVPARLVRRMRCRRYLAAIVLCPHKPDAGYLNVDLVAMRAKPKRIIYFLPDGRAVPLTLPILVRKMARFALDCPRAALAFEASTLFIGLLALVAIFDPSPQQKVTPAPKRYQG